MKWDVFSRELNRSCKSVAVAAEKKRGGRIKIRRKRCGGKNNNETNKLKHGYGRVCACENQVKKFLLKRKFIIKTFETCINPL